MQERSSSAVIFYWGIKKEFKQLELHNIFFSSDYKKEFDHIFKFKQLSSDPTIYLNVTSKMENSHAPQGSENWFVMVERSANTGQNWENLKERLRNTVINKLSAIRGRKYSAFDSNRTYSRSIVNRGTNGFLYGFFIRYKFQLPVRCFS